MQRNVLLRLSALLLTVLCLLTVLPLTLAAGSQRYVNPKTDYTVLILDDLNLLTSGEERALVEEMSPITEFGHVIFWTTEESTHGDERAQAARKLQSLTGNDESCIFVINMNARKITLECHGAMERNLTSSKARSITDNVSRYATKKDYYRCAAEAYQQAAAVLRGNRISEPMRYLSYGVISMVLGLLIAALIVFGKKHNTLYKKEAKVPLAAEKSNSQLTRPNVVRTHTDRVYSPPESSDSGGGGGGGGGGGFSSSGGSSSF